MDIEEQNQEIIDGSLFIILGIASGIQSLSIFGLIILGVTAFKIIKGIYETSRSV